jgi:hypothetical protein
MPVIFELTSSVEHAAVPAREDVQVVDEQLAAAPGQRVSK